MSVVEVIQKSAEFLRRKGVDSPRLQAELLLAHVLGLPRLELYLQFERRLTGAELDAMRQLVRRRGDREPLQHLTGSVNFHGLELAVTRDVLVPRPETEVLAGRALEFLQQRAGGAQRPVTALDLGTGSGCLANLLAVRCPAAEVWAVDASAAALAVARSNAARHGAPDRIRFLEGDWFKAVPAGSEFDLIVANPPYIPTAEIAQLQPEVREFDPRAALDGGADGLDFFRRLANEGLRFLKRGGRLMAEFGDGQADALRELFTGQGWTVEAIEPDLSGRQRVLVAGPAGTR